jgi:hypothetical protein
MLRLFRAAVAFFGVLALPTAAEAWPISSLAWSYSCTFHAAGEPAVPYVFIGTSGGGANDYTLYARLYNSLPLGPGSFMAGPATVMIGIVPPSVAPRRPAATDVGTGV